MTIVHLHVSLTSLEDGGFVVLDCEFRKVVCLYRLLGAASDGTYLTTAIKAAADSAAKHLYIRLVNIATGHISTAKSVTVQIQVVCLFLGDVLNIMASEIWIGLTIGVFEHVTYVTIIDGQVGSTPDRTTLAASIDITLDGRNTIGERVNIGGVGICFTYHDMCLTIDIAGEGISDAGIY